MIPAGLPPPPPPPPPAGFGVTVASAGPEYAYLRAGQGGAAAAPGAAGLIPPPAPAAVPAGISTFAPAPAPAPAAAPSSFSDGPPMLSQRMGAMAFGDSEPPMLSQASHQRAASASWAPVAAPAPAPSPVAQQPQSSAVQTHNRSVSGFDSASSNDSGRSQSVAVAGSAPALTAIRGELNAILDEGRSAFNSSREFKHGSKELKKIDPDGRLTSMVGRLWYRFAFLVNAKYLGGGSDLIKECILVLTVLCEVRQSVVDVFEYSKSMGDKVSIIVTRHAWLFDVAKRIEAIVGRIGMKVAQLEGKDKGVIATTYVPQLLEAPLALFEDRLANYTQEQQQVLFEECGNLKSLRSQVESYLALNYEVALISLFITEAVGKAVGVLLPQKEKRKLYFSSLLSTYSVCRANSWMLLRANHSIDIGKTGSKLNVQVAAPSGSTISSHSDASKPGMPSVGAADVMRQHTVTSSTTRALPNEESLRAMMDGIVLTGYFAVPNIDEPITQRMAVWYDLVEGSAMGNPSAAFGKKGALFWVPEKAPRNKSADCSLPISDITDILLGKQTKVFQTTVGAKANPGCCVTLVAKGGYSMNFEAATKEALTQWMSGLTKLANASGKKMYEEGQQPKTAPPTQPAASAAQAQAPAAAGSAAPATAAAPVAASSASASPASVAAPISTPPLHSTVTLVAVPALDMDPPPLLSATNKTAAPPLVNGGWIRCTAPDGNFYYYSTVTKESVWVQPAEYVSEGGVSEPAEGVHDLGF